MALGGLKEVPGRAGGGLEAARAAGGRKPAAVELEVGERWEGPVWNL